VSTDIIDSRKRETSLTFCNVCQILTDAPGLFWAYRQRDFPRPGLRLR